MISMFCFFKQKTAYEMRISDWSSDVCSSDLAALQALAERLGVADRVIFAGPVPDDELTAHYDLASIFVMPSRFLGAEASVEGLGLVYLEAMANGLPVVAGRRSEEHTSELQSLMRISYAVFCLKKKNRQYYIN